jgi:hypothetical protein
VVEVGEEVRGGVAKQKGAQPVLSEGSEDMAEAAGAVGMAEDQASGHGEVSKRKPLGLWDME